MDKMLLIDSYKKVLTGFLSFISLFIISISCDTTEPPLPPVENKNIWRIIPELAEADVRYILKHENTLYLTCLFNGREYRGSIWKTTDGENWIMLRTFEKAVGPLAINGDSLFCLGDSLFKYIIPTDSWENVCQPYPLNTDVQAVSEMIFFGNTLYAFENYFDTGGVYKIDFSGNVENLAPFYMYTKFAKMIKKNVNDMWCYARGRYHSGGFFIFTLEGFSVLSDGLTRQVLLNPPSNSLEIRNDTLFAGFRYPGIIKYLDESNVWRNYTDSIPTTRLDASSPYVEPTEISCLGDRMFVSTDIFGVMEWKKGIGWTDMAEGLRTYDWSDGKVFYPIVFLENINQTLIAASGAPGYAAWGGNGVYKYKVK
ncbi:MAG: hypothetical protein IT276_01860 [Ignavibacteriaceae bacterium]|nr:hypothetical protein [Ignavibacteriaceae bacterium]HRP93185.1 hypothetical protein [Ignavibacteriaceae bacterium]HRQ54070.1 hypothetical protein [Ignavibacteriaceae bacterium]